MHAPQPHPAVVGPRPSAPAPPLALAEAAAAARPALLARARALAPGDAEDLVQETLARVLARGASYDPARPLLPWLHGVLTGVFIDGLRRAGRAPGGLRGGTDAALAEAAIPWPGPDELAARADLVARLLASLGEPERTILDRFHRHGESVADLARALGLPEGTVKSHLHRARRRLAEGPTRP